VEEKNEHVDLVQRLRQSIGAISLAVFYSVMFCLVLFSLSSFLGLV
jgi:hypothetical protein